MKMLHVEVDPVQYDRANTFDRVFIVECGVFLHVEFKLIIELSVVMKRQVMQQFQMEFNSLRNSVN